MTRQTLIAAMIAAAATGSSLAQPLSEQFLYQGELTDQGAPANGNYDLIFRLFDAPSGGSLIGNPISRTNTPVTDGYLQTTVGFGGIGLIFDGQRRWLEVAVRPAGSGSYTTLGRTEVTATPYASYAINAESATFAELSGTTLDEAYDNGRVINADAGPVVIASTGVGASELELGGTGARQGEMRLFNFNAVRTLEMGSFNPGGYVQGYGATGDTVWQIAPDTSNWGGGSAFIYRNTGGGSGTTTGTNFGIQLEGNWAGTERSRLIMYGDSGNIQFAMDQTGDASVALPVDAINASEMRNESGVASVVGSPVTLTPVASTRDNITSATISCPTSGFIVALATLEGSISHVQGIESSAEFGLSDVSGTFSTSQDIELRIEGNSPSGLYDHPVTLHGVFPVTAGTRTFYLVGDQNSTGHSVTANDPTLSLIFIPTSYGSVSGSRQDPRFAFEDHEVPSQRGGLRPEQILAERAQAVAENEARIDAELAAIRERMHALEAELAAELAERSSR